MYRRGLFRSAWMVAALLIACGSQISNAQVEMVVRFDDAPPPQVRSSLDTSEPGALAVERPEELFDGVNSHRRLFARFDRAAVPPIDAYVITVADSTALDRLKRSWESTPGVAYAEQTYTYTLNGFEERAIPRADSLSHLDIIRAREAWEVHEGNPDVVIGFIDTGLHFDHPDLLDQVAIHQPENAQGDGTCNLFPVEEGGDFTGRDDADNGYADDVCGFNFVHRSSSFFPHERGRGPNPAEPLVYGHPHGTAVAGVLSASLNSGEIAGVAPGTSILPLRAFDTRGQGRDTEISEAIVYAADQGVDVLNMSFGEIYHSPLLREAVAYAADKGVVMVASAGNQGNNDPHYPSDFEDVLSVAWLNQEGTDRTAFSSYGSQLDLGAPSTGVYTSSLPDSEGEIYRRFSGSSFAAPQVAATAALLLSIDESLTPDAIRHTLRRSAEPLRGGWNDRTGAGRLDVAAALTSVLPGSVEIASPGTDEGTSKDRVPIIGTAIDPSFDSYTIEVAGGEPYGSADTDLEWVEIARHDRQVRGDTLTIWDTHDLPDGQYNLRLRVELTNGETIVAENRVFLYRSASDLQIHLLGEGISGARRALMADVETDHLSELSMEIRYGSREKTVSSDRRARRHGLIWIDNRGDSETVHVTIKAENAAGYQTEIDTTIALTRLELARDLMEEERLSIPSGHLLPFSTDFAGNDLRELVLSPYQNGIRTDTLAIYESRGHDFTRVHSVTSEEQRQVIPRDLSRTCVAPDDAPALLFTSVDGTGLFHPSGDSPYPTEELDLNDFVDGPDDVFGIQWIYPESGPLLVDWQSDHFRFLSCSGDTYQVVGRLENPTPADGIHADSNRFDVPNIHADDLTENERLNLLAGDADGDWIMYEETGAGQFESVWNETNERVQAGAIFSSGKLTGEEGRQFITHNRAWPTPYREDSLRQEEEPPIQALYLWEAGGNGVPQLLDRYLVAGSERPRDMQAVDLSGDGVEEIALLLSPHLYVFSAESGRLRPRFHRGPSHGANNYIDGDRMVAEDVSGNGNPELIVPARDGSMRRFTFRHQRAEHPTPRWVAARPDDHERVFLEWRASSADSVQVFGAPAGESLDRIISSVDSTVQLKISETTEFRLRAFYGENSSALSEAREVSIVAPTVVKDVRYPDTNRVNVIFSEPIDPSVRAEQFHLRDLGKTADGLTKGENGRGVYLKFEDLSEGHTDELWWHDLMDEHGREVSASGIAVEFPATAKGQLFVEDWERTGPQTVRLQFSAPLNQQMAEQSENYKIAPTGYVARARWNADSPQIVELEIAGTRIGATGRETNLNVVQMLSRDGDQLASEGFSVNLNEMADDLSDVYIYPNPHRERDHTGPVRIAGLPVNARVLILSVDGQRVAEIEPSATTGGAVWNRDDMESRPVPPGIYIARIDAPGERPIIRNVAIIR